MFSSNTSAVSADANYIEECFSTHLYTGNGSTQTITNGIDLAGKGGLTWLKQRDGTFGHYLTDTARGAGKSLQSNSTSAESTDTSRLSAFNSNGFSLGNSGATNANASTYASWTFRKQPKFFDVVTYTGNGSNRTIAHNLGSVPGCIIVKRTDAAAAWLVYHRSTSALNGLFLNGDNAAVMNSVYWNNTDPTSTEFTVGTSSLVNTNGGTYVAYLFAHDAGGFGLTGTDNVISCGSFTVDGSGYAPTVNLGYEPQWVLFKRTDSSQFGNWNIIDNMRGWVNPGGTAADDRLLFPNTSGAEDQFYARGWPTATGFYLDYLGAPGSTYIYIAIRRGPMKTPTSGTSVFQPTTFTSQAGADTVSSGSVPVVDWGFVKLRTSTQLWIVGDRLRGGPYLSFDTTSAEASNVFAWDKQNSFVTDVSDTPASFIGYSVRRAPGFFDVVCYTGTGSSRAQAHNLGVAPELIIARSRDPGSNWQVFYDFGGSTFSRIILNTTAAAATGLSYGSQLSSAPTESNINLGASFPNSIEPVVQYLFASCPGVSKVGSYTGNGSSQTINCGFTGGARFVMVKRTDSTGNWMVVDTARGLVSASDPTLYLNSTAAEVTGVDWLDPDNSGFIVNQESTMNANVNGATYIYLSIA